MTNARLSKTVAYYASFVILGMAAAALGPALPWLAKHTFAQLAGISFLFTAHSLGYMIGSYQSGRLYDRVAGHPVMAGALLIMAAMLALTPVIPLLWLLTLTTLILGMSAGAVDVGGNTLLVWVHGRKVGPFMNGLHFFWGAGSFLTPIIVAQSLSWSGDVNGAYWVVALVALPMAAWLLRLPSPTSQATADDRPLEASSTDQPATTQRTSERVFTLLIVLLLLLHVGAETGFGGWIYTYALAQDLANETTAAYLTSAFWGALTLGRLLAIPLALRFRPSALLLADLVGCVLSVGVLILWPHSQAATWLGTLGLGLSMASIFPTAISWAERRIPITGRATGWFLVGASVGGMSLPWLIGQLFVPLGPGITMVVIMVDLVITLGLFAAMMLYSSRRLSPAEIMVYNEGGYHTSPGE